MDLTAEYILSFDVGKVNLGLACFDKTSNQLVSCRLISLGGKDLDSRSIAVKVNEIVSNLLSEWPRYSIEVVLVEKQILYGTRSPGQYFDARTCTTNAMVEACLHSAFLANNVETVTCNPNKSINYLKEQGVKKHENRHEKKKNTIKYVRELIKNENNVFGFSKEAKSTFQSLKKKDDVADAIVQVLAHLGD
jgi:hypothetical protein